MYGLFYYTYDHYEFSRLVAVSEEVFNLKKHWEKCCNFNGCELLVMTEEEHIYYQDELEKHYYICEILCV